MANSSIRDGGTALSFQRKKRNDKSLVESHICGSRPSNPELKSETGGGQPAMVQISPILLSAAVFMASQNVASAGPAILPNGSYQIVSRLELPHVERWAVDQTTKVCLSGAPQSGSIPIPVLSASSQFAICTATNLEMTGSSIEYDIVCPGRASAKAQASYTLKPDGFSGRVFMIMAAKNMTMTEVVRARRLGECR
jgi:hypothetical protein